jgi:hypothetical protein
VFSIKRVDGNENIPPAPRTATLVWRGALVENARRGIVRRAVRASILVDFGGDLKQVLWVVEGGRVQRTNFVKFTIKGDGYAHAQFMT